MARRSTKTRELVRLSPVQFSLSISIVVILLGAAGLAGYFYGLKQASRVSAARLDASRGGSGQQTDAVPAPAGTDDPVTFYTALKEPRKDAPAAPRPEPVEKKAQPVEPEPVKPQDAVPAVKTAVVPGRGSVVLQVASYKDRSPAQKLLQELSREGYAGTVVRADLGERGTWFRVRIGPYEKGDADVVLTRLRDERKLKGYVVK